MFKFHICFPFNCIKTYYCIVLVITFIIYKIINILVLFRLENYETQQKHTQNSFQEVYIRHFLHIIKEVIFSYFSQKKFVLSPPPPRHTN